MPYLLIYTEPQKSCIYFGLQGSNWQYIIQTTNFVVRMKIITTDQISIYLNTNCIKKKHTKKPQVTYVYENVRNDLIAKVLRFGCSAWAIIIKIEYTRKNLVIYKRHVRWVQKSTCPEQNGSSRSSTNDVLSDKNQQMKRWVEGYSDVYFRQNTVAAILWRHLMFTNHRRAWHRNNRRRTQ